jgi:hypothetical protein
MSATPRQRRSPGEGGAYPYKTGAGERWRVKGMVGQPDGTHKVMAAAGRVLFEENMADALVRDLSGA